jgi:hypothetical protein
MKATALPYLVLLAMIVASPSTLGQTEGPSLRETIDYLHANTAPPRSGAASPVSDEISFHVDASGIWSDVIAPMDDRTDHYFMPMEEVQYASFGLSWAGSSEKPTDEGAIIINCGARRGKCISWSVAEKSKKSPEQFAGLKGTSMEVVLYDSNDRKDRLTNATTHMIALLATDYARTHPAQKDPFASSPQR